MAFMKCCISADGKRMMSMEEFKRWLKQFDADKDGKINRAELENAVRGAGGWFVRRKASRGLLSADSNGNGFIDDSEINSLVDFAQKHLGVRIIQL
ncbi:hypothetical protein Tsubulata_048674 [Turnera subulata]|uniref:EF-hand domain-containing protein n=1 Tax=Turnera subulata TaxID=218843 RepID=A0A9Q0F7H5_9ROSI|nr:hypothetical protein Tsubulata_048674 [Turnera subulata]